MPTGMPPELARGIPRAREAEPRPIHGARDRTGPVNSSEKSFMPTSAQRILCRHLGYADIFREALFGNVEGMKLSA